MKFLRQHSSRQTIKQARGASLFEVLIAFAVLALGITSIVSFQGRLAQNSDHAKARTEAANIGQAALETMRNYVSLAEFDALTSGTDTVGPAGSGADVEISNLNHVYTRTWTVTNSSTSKAVAMQVTWPDRSGATTGTTMVKLNTIIARVDPTQTVLDLGSTTTTTATTTTTTTTSTTTTTTATVAPTTTTTSTSSASTSTSTSSTTTTSTSTSTTSTSTTTSTTTTTAGTYLITISGTFTIKEGDSSVHVSGVTMTSGTCSVNGDTSYTCTSDPISIGSTYTGTVTVSTNKVVCSTNPATFTNISTDQTRNFTLAKNASKCS